jgi:hypothetical protein
MTVAEPRPLAQVLQAIESAGSPDRNDESRVEKLCRKLQHSFHEKNMMLNEIQYLKQQLRDVSQNASTTIEAEREAMDQLVESNVRTGVLACVWCIKTQYIKMMAMAFNRWKVFELPKEENIDMGEEAFWRLLKDSVRSKLKGSAPSSSGGPGSPQAQLLRFMHAASKAAGLGEASMESFIGSLVPGGDSAYRGQAGSRQPRFMAQGTKSSQAKAKSPMSPTLTAGLNASSLLSQIGESRVRPPFGRFTNPMSPSSPPGRSRSPPYGRNGPASPVAVVYSALLAMAAEKEKEKKAKSRSSAKEEEERLLQEIQRKLSGALASVGAAKEPPAPAPAPAPVPVQPPQQHNQQPHQQQQQPQQQYQQHQSSAGGSGQGRRPLPQYMTPTMAFSTKTAKTATRSSSTQRATAPHSQSHSHPHSQSHPLAHSHSHHSQPHPHPQSHSQAYQSNQSLENRQRGYTEEMSYYDIKGFHPQDYYHYEQQRPATGPTAPAAGPANSVSASRVRDDNGYVELHSLQQLHQQRLHSGSVSSSGAYTPANASGSASVNGSVGGNGGQRLFLGPASSHRHGPGTFPDVDYDLPPPPPAPGPTPSLSHPHPSRSGAVHSSPNKYYHHQQQYQRHRYEQSDMDDDDAAVGIYEDIDVSDNDTNSEVYLQAYRNGQNGQNGRNGQNGQNGRMGHNGQNGQNGQNGKTPQQRSHQAAQPQYWAQQRGYSNSHTNPNTSYSSQHNRAPAPHSQQQQQASGRRR